MTSVFYFHAAATVKDLRARRSPRLPVRTVDAAAVPPEPMAPGSNPARGRRSVWSVPAHAASTVHHPKPRLGTLADTLLDRVGTPSNRPHPNAQVDLDPERLKALVALVTVSLLPGRQAATKPAATPTGPPPDQERSDRRPGTRSARQVQRPRTGARPHPTSPGRPALAHVPDTETRPVLIS